MQRAAAREVDVGRGLERAGEAGVEGADVGVDPGAAAWVGGGVDHDEHPVAALGQRGGGLLEQAGAQAAHVVAECVAVFDDRGRAEQRADEPGERGVAGVDAAPDRRAEPRVADPQRAYSTARDSRITVTLIWPGYSSSFSMSRAISWESRAAPSSSTAPGATMTRISRPACIA